MQARRRRIDIGRVPRVPGRLAALALLVAGLSGCSHFGNDMLEITPTSFPECQAPNIAVHVRWNAEPVVKDGGVQLFVYKPGGEPRLWMLAGPQGDADTGLWASDGWTVVLLDDHGKLLATRTLQTTACPAVSG